MKTWVVLVVIGVLGVAGGLTVTTIERFTARDLFIPEDDEQGELNMGPIGGGAEIHKWPQAVVVGDATHDFGSMERNSKKSHTFRIRNDGDEALTLALGRVTCKCTVSDFEGKSFAPGETAEIKLEWTGKTFMADPDFAQIAEVITNDPQNERIQLRIKGYVTENIRALPDQVAVGRVSSNDGTTTEFRLFGFRSDTVKIREVVLENESTSEHFDVEFSPLPEEEVKEEKGATSGLLATLHLKPGLPLGPIVQTIRIDATTEKDVQIHVPIVGRTIGDFQFASSRRFQSVRSLLNLGPLKRDESVQEVLHLFVTGEHRHATKISVGELSPTGYFDVTIGEPVQLNNGKTVKYDITIEIPPGSEPVNRLGLDQDEQGRIVLETTHPKTKQLPLAVRFGVD